VARAGVLDAADGLAIDLLGQSGDRWAHTRAVAARAAEATVVLPADQRSALVAAAWLHDIGYVAAMRETGFHPLDGARHLERRGWPRVIVGLVAHHSGARFVAAVLGLDEELADFAEPMLIGGPLADALTWADQTTSPSGQTVDLGTRMAGWLRGRKRGT
jgi:HD superfamily phosphodiesterase